MKETKDVDNMVVHIRLSDTDKQILMVLWKCPWMFDRHIAMLLGLPVKYVRRRLQTLAKNELIRRKTIGAGDPAVNYITAQGIREAGLPHRNTSMQPSYGSYLHDLGMIDTYVYLSILRMKSGRTYTEFGSIITERDFMAVSEVQPTGKYKNNGQPILKSLNDGIHEPDGYLFRGDMIIAIEFERVMKSKKSNSQMKDNIIDLSKRFDKQIWVYGNNSVRNKLEEIKKEVPDIILVDYDRVVKYLDQCVQQLPQDIPRRTGVAAISHIGTLREPIALHKIPLKKSVQLEGQAQPVSSAREVRLER